MKKGLKGSFFADIYREQIDRKEKKRYNVFIRSNAFYLEREKQ